MRRTHWLPGRNRTPPGASPAHRERETDTSGVKLGAAVIAGGTTASCITTAAATSLHAWGVTEQTRQKARCIEEVPPFPAPIEHLNGNAKIQMAYGLYGTAVAEVVLACIVGATLISNSIRSGLGKRP